ncbi:unnamed protein product [Hermetia illucens]|uniref:SIFamide n=1 Tax=Hermetia illucens TaxID=343691 RepID=A0A7R8YN41_HERIL|nr:neuropeptide SIFamide [Hermetia illucens]CAD7078060.1 unnamed protein product [Hermetia illucens]
MAFKNGLAIAFLGLLLIMAFAVESQATYRKPPFNGSIFGKRNSVDYDPNGKAISAMCEIALEACQSWLPQDKK